MSKDIRPDDVLAEIPGWEDANWSELSGGLSNNVYRVARGDEHGVLKIDSFERSAPLNTRRAEAAVQSNAADAGLAGRVLFFNERAYLTEYVRGDVWDSSSLKVSANLEKLSTALRKLHSLPLTGRSFDARFAASQYAQLITAQDGQMISVCIGIIEDLPEPQDWRCCHNDLVAENLVATPHVKFLDWEYACDNSPLFDLATVVEHHELSDLQVDQLLDAYFDGNGAAWRRQMASQRSLYRALLWLWMASRPKTDPAELCRVAERVTTSYS